MKYICNAQGKKQRTRLEAINRDYYKRKINEKAAAQLFLLTVKAKRLDAPVSFFHHKGRLMYKEKKKDRSVELKEIDRWI